MSGIPSKCPKCGKAKPWKEEVNGFTSGISLGLFGRLRIGAPKGLFARPIRKATGCYDVTYRCHSCGFRGKYPISE